MQAYRLPKDTAEQQQRRGQAIQDATWEAARVPLAVARAAVQVLELAQIVAEQGNLNAICDAGTAAALGRAALTGAGLNVRINLNSLQGKTGVQEMLDELQSVEQRAKEIESTIQTALSERGGLPLP